MQTRLMRSKTDQMICGVCGGLAAYLNVDSVLVRLAFLMLIFASGIGLPLYFILCILMPEEEGDDDRQDHPDWDVEEEIKITGEDVENIKANNKAADGRANPNGPIVFAAILIAIGLYLLGQNMGILGWFSVSWFGPLIIIGLGLYVIYRSRNNE